MKFIELLDTHNNQPDSFATEGFLDVSELSNYFTGFISKVVGIFETKKLIPFAFVRNDLRSAVALINKRSKFELENFAIITPEYIDGSIVPYLQALREVLAELSNIEVRILKPLENWAANMLTTPGYADKLWLAMPTADKKVEEYSDKLHAYFNDSVGDGVANRSFMAVYGDGNGLTHAATLVEDLTTQSMKMLDGKLSTNASSLAKFIHNLSEKSTAANEVHNLPEEKIKPIIALVIQAARELELLAIVLFNIKTVTYAHSETVNKINNQLK